MFLNVILYLCLLSMKCVHKNPLRRGEWIRSELRVASIDGGAIVHCSFV